jgi:hypothetical protein
MKLLWLVKKPLMELAEKLLKNVFDWLTQLVKKLACNNLDQWKRRIDQLLADKMAACLKNLLKIFRRRSLTRATET